MGERKGNLGQYFKIGVGALLLKSALDFSLYETAKWSGIAQNYYDSHRIIPESVSGLDDLLLKYATSSTGLFDLGFGLTTDALLVGGGAMLITSGIFGLCRNFRNERNSSG